MSTGRILAIFQGLSNNNKVARQASGMTSKWHDKQKAHPLSTGVVPGTFPIIHPAICQIFLMPLLPASSLCCQPSVVAIMCQLPSMPHTQPTMPATRMPCLGNISNIPDTTMARPTPFWHLKFRVKYILVKLIIYMF